MGKYSKISGNTFYRNFPTRPTYGDPTYGGLTVLKIDLKVRDYKYSNKIVQIKLNSKCLLNTKLEEIGLKN